MGGLATSSAWRRAPALGAFLVAAGVLAGAVPVHAQTTQNRPASCDPATPTVPLAPQEIAGTWQQVEPKPGVSVNIAPKSPNDTTNFVLHATHDWPGSYANGKLVFKRKPTVDEMSHDAPEWARQALVGQIEWRLELEPKLVCGARVITGKWFHGRIKIDEDTATNGVVTKRAAVSAGDGDPIPLRYEQTRPAIYGVVVLDDQTGFAAKGVPYHPYPYPEPPASADKSAALGREEFNPFAFSVYSPDAEIYNANNVSRYQRAANGRLVVPNERRTLYVYGQGLPRDRKTKITIKPSLGAAGLEYTVLALGTDEPMDQTYRQMFEKGRLEAEKDLQGDSDALDLIRRSEAMLIRVDLRSSVLPGMKDFTINDIRGNSRWRLRFGDDRALISFGRDVEGDTDLTDSLFLPERTFIEVKTEVALPVTEIPLRISINDQRVKWAGGDTLIAKQVPAADDPSRRTYRTATIELFEPGKPFSPLEPGLVFLPAKPNDKILAKFDDEALFFALSRPATVYRTPAQLGMTWKEALQRAAKAARINVSDWGALPGQKAAEIVKEKLVDVDFQNPYKAGQPLKISVTVGDLAALLLFRDEFVRRMKVAVNDKDNFPAITDNAALRGLRKRLQPDAWDPSSAWSYLKVTCPDGSSCAFSYVLSDDFLQQTFKDNRAAADQWMVKAMAEAVRNYKDAASEAIKTAEGISDGYAEGLIGLLGQDCTSEALDLPCGYKALRPLLLPRMMRLVDLDNPQRYLWIPDLNARYVSRNLYTLISAVKAQQALSSASTQTGLMIITMLAGPALSEAGMVGEVVQAAMSAPGANTLITFATEIPEGLRAKWEVRFAQGASLVLGQERLSQAVAQRNEWVNGLVSALGQSIVMDAIALPRVGAEIRTARILDEIEALRAQGYKGLDPKYRNAFLRTAIDAKVLEATGNAKAMSEFDKRASAAFDKVAEDMNFRAAPTEQMPASTVIEAKGDPAPYFAEQPPPEPPPLDPAVAQQETPIPSDFEAEAATRPATPRAPTAATVPAAPEAPATLDLSAIPPNTVIGGFTIGQKLGEGVDAAVYRVTNPGVAGCENGCVIKFYKSTRAADVVRDIQNGEALLANGTGILQLKNLQYGTEGRAYIIQQEIRGTRLDALLKQGQPLPQLAAMEKGSRLLFGLGESKALDDAQKAFFRQNRELGRAVVRLYHDLVEHGLAWEDGHPNNLFFEKQADGTWRAGILDQDRLIKFAERNTVRMRELFGDVETGWMPARCRSLEARRSSLQAAYQQRLEAWAHANYGKPATELTTEEAQLFGGSDSGPFFPNAEFFMEKAFEYKGYISFDPKTKQFVDGLIRVEDVKELFPLLGQPDRHAPIDVSLPHWWKTSMADPMDGKVIVFTPRARGRAASDGALRMAA